MKTSSEILRLRLQNTGLSNSPFRNVQDCVSHLGAVQAQDFGAAKWALGQRIRNSTDHSIENAFNDGRILRTHVLRPTWHFVTPENIRWMLELTSPRVKKILSSYNRKMEIDDALLAKSNDVIVRSLRNQPFLTRQELKRILEGIGIQTNVQRLAHIVMWAELDALICSGPRSGKQLTYALLDERAAKSKRLNREEALAKLAFLYWKSHGPAQLRDFSWWSGLSVKDAMEALSMVQSKLDSVTIRDKCYWYFPQSKSGISKASSAFLLSIYDEYTIAYKDRSDLSEAPRDMERLITMGNALTSVVILKDKVAGTWKKSAKKNAIEIRLDLFHNTTKKERDALLSEVERYGKFLGIQAHAIDLNEGGNEWVFS